MMSGRYQRAFTVAVVFLVAGWHLAGAGGQLLHNRSAYGSFAFQGAMWLVMALAITAGSVLVLRGTPGWRPAWAVALIALAASTAAAAASPAGQMLAVNWAWGSAGWTGVLVLLRRRFAELAWFLAAEALAILGVQVRDGLHRTDLAGFLAVLAWSTGAQVAVAAGVRALDVAAGQAAAAAQSEHAARERAATAEIIRAARHARWLALQESAVPLVAELAAGTADPGHAQVRSRCAVQAARLRRLLAEGDEVPGSLVHELHASADVAEPRGVAVEIETAGPLPQVPGPARRVITDAAIAILTAAPARRGSPWRRWPPESPSASSPIPARSSGCPQSVRGSPSNSSKTMACSGRRRDGTARDGGDHRRPSGRHQGVASWIQSDPGQRVRLVQTARDLTGLHAVPRPPADVVILDLELSGELVTTQIPGLVAAGYRVVAFSGHSDPAIVMETLDNGAHAYVSKEEGRDHLVEAVLAAAADRPYVTRSQARAMLADQRPARPTLSQQERQALLLWFQGMSKASVGRRMSITENTVRQYISRARAKYAATGRTAPSKDALLARAIEDGVIKPSEIMPYKSLARAAADRPSLGVPGR